MVNWVTFRRVRDLTNTTARDQIIAGVAKLARRGAGGGAEYSVGVLLLANYK